VFSSARRTALALAATAVVLASAPAAAQAPGEELVSGAGPAGRLALSTWTFRSDGADKGLARGWQRGGFAGQTVSVPHAIDAGAFKGAAGARNYNGSLAWYRTTFDAPEAGTYVLGFSSANFQASVWIDAHAVGSHRGSYLPFEARASLAPGSHTVVVRIDWRDPEAQARAGFHRTWFNWGGLNGEVSLRRAAESELSDPTLQTALAGQLGEAQSASVRVGVQVKNNGPSRTIAPQGTLTHGERSIPISFPARSIEAGQTLTMTGTATLAQPALWSPSSPALYQLTLSVGQGSSFSARVGLRQFSWHGGRLYLNGQRLRMHGASLQEDALGHGDALTGADEDALVRELKTIGANAVRSQHPLDPGLLERLDSAGILVWQGLGPVEGAGHWFSNTPRLVRGAIAQAKAAAIAASLHPSIFAWNLVDEVAGNGQGAAEVSYVQSMTHWLHANDPTRLVAVDVWGGHAPAQAGALYNGVDAIAQTDYTGWYDGPRASPSEQIAMMRARLAAMRRTFAGKVLMISEFGAEANTLNAPGRPGSYAYQASLLARHIGVYAAAPQLTGMLIWDLRDYALIPGFQGGSIRFNLPRLRMIEGLIQKGLFTDSGSAKPAVATVARLYKALPAG
jgi:hypothetical protein